MVRHGGANDIPDEAFCESAADFYRPPARTAIMQLCADVFGSRHLTAIEFLHSEYHMRNIYENGELLNAFQKAALAQSVKAETSPQQRQRALIAMFDKVVAHTRKLSRLYQPKRFDPATFGELVGDIQKRFTGDERSFVLFQILAFHLDNSSSWLTKIHKLARLYHPDLDDEAVGHLDEVLAEIMLTSAALGELLGREEGSEDVTSTLIALHDGLLGGATDGSGPKSVGDVVTGEGTLANINALIGTKRFPRAQQAVGEVIKRIIESPRRFRRDEKAGSELTSLLDTYALFENASQMLRDSAVKEAFTRRVGRAVSEDTLINFRKSEPRPGQRLEKLLFFRRFADSDFKIAAIEAEIERAFGDENLYDDLAQGGENLIEKLQVFARLYERITDTPMDAMHKLEIMARISNLQWRFIKENDFFNSLSWMVPDLVERALMVLDLCRDRLFVDGKARKFAHRIARQGVADEHFRKLYLKDTKSDAEAAERLVSLRQRLIEAGLME